MYLIRLTNINPYGRKRTKTRKTKSFNLKTYTFILNMEATLYRQNPYYYKQLVLRITVMAGFLSRFCGQIKGWIQWSWTYLWAVWFMLVVFVIYILRGPLKLSENMSHGKHFCVSTNNLVHNFPTRLHNSLTRVMFKIFHHARYRNGLSLTEKCICYQIK